MTNDLPGGISIFSLPGCSPEEEAIDRLVDGLCDICKSSQPICPVNDDAAICPQNVIEKAEYEYYHRSG